MIDRLDLGPTPLEENCTQVGDANYEKAILECQTYIEQIKRECGPPPQGCALFVKGNDHDFGRYYSVYVGYDSNIKATEKYALKVQNKGPLEWDRESLLALGMLKRLKQLDDDAAEGGLLGGLFAELNRDIEKKKSKMK